MRVVVTGANRGIGLELVRQLSEREAIVEAAVRQPDRADALHELAASAGERIRIHRCDVSNDESVAAFSLSLGPVPVDVLINNAAMPPVRDSFDAVQPGDMLLQTINVNAVGPLRVTSALLKNIREGQRRQIFHIGSILGSIADTRTGDSFGYRMSKAALNMASRALAEGLRPEGITSVVIHPGWVQTDMGGPRAALTVQESAAAILALIEKLGLRQSGAFLDYRGRLLHW